MKQKKNKSSKQKIKILFVDFKSAYDNVKREKLYEILKDKNILNDVDIKLLKFIHSNLVITIGNESTKTNKGVPQGLTTSPLLYNIYA